MTVREGFRYRAHGLEIVSDFEIREFMPSAREDAPDIRIRLDEEAEAVARRAAAVQHHAPQDASVLEAAPEDGGGVMNVEDVGAYWVRRGSEIHVAPAPEADPGMVTLYTLGTAMGLALFQRGALILHGASIAHGGRATVVLGPSGAGKSTLAARLGLAGRRILGDDTVALWPTGETGRFVTHPAGTSFKLWRDALAAAGLSDAAGHQVAARIDKFYLANPLAAEERPHELAELLVLGALPSGAAPQIEPLSLLEAVRTVNENVYRPQFASTFGGRDRQFVEVASLVGRVPVARLLRPWDHGATAEVVEFLRERWDGERIGGTMRAGTR